jgi:hypothetical protein
MLVSIKIAINEISPIGTITFIDCHKDPSFVPPIFIFGKRIE